MPKLVPTKRTIDLPTNSYKQSAILDRISCAKTSLFTLCTNIRKEYFVLMQQRKPGTQLFGVSSMDVIIIIMVLMLILAFNTTF